MQVIRLPNFTRNEEGELSEIHNSHTQHPKAPDNWPYAGITRSVALVSESETSIRKTQVRLNGQALEVAVCLQTQASDRKETSFNITLSSPVFVESVSKEVNFLEQPERVLRFSIPLKPDSRRWSPDSPNLYTLTTTLSREKSPVDQLNVCLLYTSPSPRDATLSRMPSSA